jgi:hypothetical protein
MLMSLHSYQTLSENSYQQKQLDHETVDNLSIGLDAIMLSTFILLNGRKVSFTITRSDSVYQSSKSHEG